MISVRERNSFINAEAAGDSRGFTLVELLVVMGIFLVVMLITAKGFDTAVTQVGQQKKSTETQIGSIVGLEMLRADLQSAGYGLPTDIQYIGAGTSAPKYKEIVAADTGMPVEADFWPPDVSPRTFNDVGKSDPRAVQSRATTFNGGSQYLVIKSLTVAPGNAPRKWATVSYTDAGASSSTTYGSAERDLAATDRVIVMRNTFVDNAASRKLQVVDGNFATTFNNYGTLTAQHSSGDVFEIYGVGDASVTDLRMPFNRADYYVRTPSPMPPACAPGTGVLYKALASQVDGGGFTEIPLMDCVADMQVVYGLSAAGTEEINNHVDSFPDTIPPWTGKDLRDRLREIRVYILAHEGKKDPTFNYPSQTVEVGEDFGGGLVGRTFNLSSIIGAEYSHYRWKVYTIVVRPKNLIQ